ncbi:MAG TPA: hypothetical protein VFU28_07660 [Vicinamibacterales bacterium]|nr:hypothetical protein [Vicinamibacterales bacterium]
MKASSVAVAVVVLASAIALPAAPRGVMLMNRIAPSTIDLFIANADGTGERKLFTNSDFDYNASFSADGQWIVFTSERNGYGQADIYRAHPDGSGLERLTDYAGLDDQGSLSPDSKQLAFVSTRSPDHKTNIWVLELATKKARNVTGGADVQVTNGKPDGFFRPSWSPNGQWIAFSSDRLTEWTGHENGAGAGHRQTLSIYVIHPDGTGLKRLTQSNVSAGTPQWSADSARVLFYETPLTPAAANGQAPGTVSQIVSVDIATGARVEHTTGPGMKVKPQFLGPARVGYLLKAVPRDGGLVTGIAYSDGAKGISGTLRAPAWSPDGNRVVYEKHSFAARPQGQLLYSWDPDYEYRYTDVFPMFSKDGMLVTTDLSSTIGNPQTSISTWNSDGFTGRRRVFFDPSGAAMMASWSPDGKQLVFGFGAFFGGRNQRPAQVMIMNADGSNVRPLTENLPNAGFPNWSPDGKSIVYRVWGYDDKKVEQRGLRLMNLADRTVKVLSTEWDNFPFFSPSGDRILFTRQKSNDKDFDVFTMKPDGTDVKQLTNTPGTDGHANWTSDGRRIFFMSTRTGFKDEREMYDNSPQPYAQVFIMDVDGTHVRQLTESRWEDSMPVYVPSSQSRSTK